MNLGMAADGCTDLGEPCGMPQRDGRAAGVLGWMLGHAALLVQAVMDVQHANGAAVERELLMR